MQKVKLPWAAWHGDTDYALSFPDSWTISRFSLEDNSEPGQEQLARKLETLKDLLKNKAIRQPVIVVDDLTRPVALDRIIDEILKIFKQSAIDYNEVRILIGLGSHRPLSAGQIEKKIGHFAASRCRCINHNPDETVPAGITWGKTDIRLNRHYLSSDFRIVISGLTPHSFAGFSGGAKMLFPGLADMETISKTHKSVLMGFMGKLGQVENNRFRQTIESFADRVGIDCFIGVVINGNRTTRNIYVGDFRDAHRRAAVEARQYYTRQLPEEKYDLVILNAFPKDTELLQAENAFIPLKSATRELLSDCGLVLLTSACSQGLGHHGLFGPHGTLYREPKPLRFLKGKHLAVFAPNISRQDFRTVFSSEYSFFREESELLQYLQTQLPDNPRVAVFSQASLQLTGEQ